MGKQISINALSIKSIQDARKQLQDYKREVERKNEVFVQRLAEEGILMAKYQIATSMFPESVTVDSAFVSQQGTAEVIVFAKGENFINGDNPPFNALMAIEFGAGIYYNGTVNPEPLTFQLGMGVGSYNPESGNAESPTGWFYYDEESGKLKHSWGVKQTMPMWNASIEMRKKVVSIAREVFGGY